MKIRRKKRPLDLAGLEDLKEMVVTAKDFHEPWDFFFTNFGERDGFMSEGRRTDHPVLKAILESIGESLFGVKEQLDDALLVEIPKHSFIHGTCIMKGHFVAVLFFYDADIGLASVLDPVSNNSQMLRFSSATVEKPEGITFVPGSTLTN